MQLKYIPSHIYICRDCNFLDKEGSLDKCPYCKSDDWIDYEKQEEEEDE